MKVLIAYDGTECSDAAIVDLRRAGLPAMLEASVLCVAEISPQLAAVPYGASIGSPGSISEAMECEDSAGRLVEEAQALTEQVCQRLHADFPGWHIDTESWLDSAGSAIIRKAHAWKPDLIVVGSHGRSGISRFVLGSVSQHVLNHVNCSVRISRHHLHSQERIIRLLIGVDESANSAAMVRTVAARNWPAKTEARVVSVLDSRIALAAAQTLEGAVPVICEDEACRRLKQAAREAAEVLSRSGLLATDQVFSGVPGDVLVAEAEKWAADCIFVGARGLNRLERLLLGSVSSAVAPHAQCSVEVIRQLLK